MEYFEVEILSSGLDCGFHLVLLARVVDARVELL